MTKKTMHMGFDDTDSTRKGCTTYVAALLVEKLEKLGVEFIDYPNLIRLNPNVPWKTRGNGALCLRVQYDENIEEKIKETFTCTVEEYSDLDFRGTDPGIVFFESAEIPKVFGVFAKETITGVVKLGVALKILRKYKAEAVGFKKGRGIIGSLAAVGETLRGDYTYEILAYRVPENYGVKRKVDENSIFAMDKATEPYTFNNVDVEKCRVIITPRGPDPILFGVRGETAEIVKKAFKMIKPLEPVERWVIFRTNQGTDAHLKRIKSLSQVKPYSSVIARGTVAENPRMILGKHVILPIKDESGRVDCAAYEPTGVLRKVAMKLLAGDVAEVYGGVRVPSEDRPLTINLEKIRLLKAAPQVIYRNPVCSECGKRLKSMGKNQGFRCEKCGSLFPNLGKVEFRLKRDVKRGLYITSTRSQRHLTKPFRRYGLEKRCVKVEGLIDGWHSP
ncbi:MAG TPA: tRNA(Ile)(2)-agmatinylcytidine synthase [Candidatus Bathyarchaeia archaeon]|nr:tRNA(Ile)(2)-agmatinylcytidine synthase [Candidatus Bathyarchaeia archaeon]